MAEKKEDVEHPIWTHFSLHHVAAKTGQLCERQGGLKSLKLALRAARADIVDNVAGLPLTIPRGAAEMFAYGIGQAAGVRGAPVRLVTKEPKNFNDFVKRVPGGWAISKRVENAIPLYYLGDKCQTVFVSEAIFRPAFVKLLDKRCPISKEDYGDFPAAPPDAVLSAARWDSPKRLATYAFRAFLNATFPHTSNVLVDTRAWLWVIDNEKLVFSPDNSDIAELKELVRQSALVMDACARVGTIDEGCIREALAAGPSVFWREGGHFDNPKEAGDYFCDRLKVWKQCFKAPRG